MVGKGKTVGSVGAGAPARGTTEGRMCTFGLPGLVVRPKDDTSNEGLSHRP